MDSVDRVLSLQGDCAIKRFSLKCKDGVDPDRVDGWICNALRRGVSELDLSINFEYYLPREMFVSKTLLKLKLTSEFGLRWWVGADGTLLPMLKSLHIASEMMSMDCDVKMERFLACFPVLEEAEMTSMDWIDAVDTVSRSGAQCDKRMRRMLVTAFTRSTKDVRLNHVR
ncbi:F-box protein [Raphanus sativus]|nr:F-box protein [Raphanus sativus]